MMKRWLQEALDFFERYSLGAATRGYEAIAAQEALKLLEEWPRPLSRQEKRLALQRRWALAFPDQEVPEDMGTLERVMPPGLDRRESRQLLRGSLEEAKATFVWTLHTSLTRAQFQERARKAGVHHALSLFDGRTRKGLEKAMRVFLTD